MSYLLKNPPPQKKKKKKKNFEHPHPLVIEIL